jgi:hypothetical protein
VVLLQVIEWMQLLAERGTESAGFKSTGFERFERVWTGQQVSLLATAGYAAAGIPGYC